MAWKVTMNCEPIFDYNFLRITYNTFDLELDKKRSPMLMQ